MFTLEIKGKAVAVIDADEQQARDLAADEEFQDDLQSMESDGEPLWNGVDPLVVRPSTKDEVQAGEAAMEDDDDEEELEGEISLVFIVPLDGDFDDDEDEAST